MHITNAFFSNRGQILSTGLLGEHGIRARGDTNGMFQAPGWGSLRGPSHNREGVVSCFQTSCLCPLELLNHLASHTQTPLKTKIQSRTERIREHCMKLRLVRGVRKRTDPKFRPCRIKYQPQNPGQGIESGLQFLCLQNGIDDIAYL